jgi:hypothetical protein
LRAPTRKRQDAFGPADHRECVCITHRREAGIVSDIDFPGPLELPYSPGKGCNRQVKNQRAQQASIFAKARENFIFGKMQVRIEPSSTYDERRIAHAAFIVQSKVFLLDESNAKESGRPSI